MSKSTVVKEEALQEALISASTVVKKRKYEQDFRKNASTMAKTA